MIQKADRSLRAVGVDVGTSRLKLAFRDGDDLRLHWLPSDAIERAADEIEAFAPEHVGLTGVGAAALADRLGLDTAPIVEFEAWHRGVAVLLEQQGEAPIVRDLIVSVGTGTSFSLATPEAVQRVGGTALGGGTLAALGRALLGVSDVDALVALAEQGDRRAVDLRLSDVDPNSALALSGDFTASFLAKLGQQDLRDADVAHALVGMVAETVGSLGSAMAAALQAKRLVYGGGTLHENAPLREVLRAYSFVEGTVFLEKGTFAGAIGAIEPGSTAPRT